MSVPVFSIDFMVRFVSDLERVSSKAANRGHPESGQQFLKIGAAIWISKKIQSY